MTQTNSTSLRLSICIPTYNRVVLLAESLQAITSQWLNDLDAEQRHLVEVVLSDNCSPDDTSALADRVAQDFPDLRFIYYRQSENKGGDANILNAARLGSGEYVYLLSDDDILLPGSLAAMLSLIEKHNGQGTFCLNTRSFTSDALESSTPDFPLDADRMLGDHNESLKFFGSRITFLSLLLFRWDRHEAESYEKYIGTYILQSYIYLDVLAKSDSIWATHNVFLATRNNNTGGYNFFQVFISEFGKLMQYARHQGYSAAAVRLTLWRHLRRFLIPFILMFKLRGSYGRLQPDFRDGAKRMLKEYGLHPFIVFVVLPMMFTPRIVARAVYRLARTLNKSPLPSRVQ